MEPGQRGDEMVPGDDDGGDGGACLARTRLACRDSELHCGEERPGIRSTNARHLPLACNVCRHKHARHLDHLRSHAADVDMEQQYTRNPLYQTPTTPAPRLSGAPQLLWPNPVWSPRTKAKDEQQSIEALPPPPPTASMMSPGLAAGETTCPGLLGAADSGTLEAFSSDR